MQLAAADPQAYAVAIAGDLNGAPFACFDSCSVPLPEGTGSANYTVTSASGRTASGASTWHRDVTPPLLGLIVPSPDGLNGWYVSPVNVSANASDRTSGMALVQGKVDDGSAWGSLPLHLGDGFYPVEIVARDVAGNETSVTDMLRIDTVPPISEFSSHPDGAIVQGSVALAGNLQDQLSGPDTEQLSLDRGHAWQATTMGAARTWSYTWDTIALPNGPDELLVRGTDAAGNRGKSARLSLLVDNRPSLVSLTNRWWVWETGTLAVTPDYFPIGSIRMTISDPQNRWPPATVDFDPGDIPASVSWDRHFGNGMVAPPGDYPVSVQACDIYGLCGGDSGIISIPSPSAATRTATPVSPLTTTASAVVTITPSASPTSTARPMVPALVRVTPIPTNTPAPIQPVPSLHWWPIVGVLGLFLAISSASLADPRPAALGRFREFLHQGSAAAPLDYSPDYDESSLGKDR